MRFRGRLLSMILLLAVLTLVFNVIHSWRYLGSRGDVIKQAEEKLAESKKQNESLKKQLAQVESRGFIEKEARNKLNLGREGEIFVFLPSISPMLEPTPTIVENLQNWQKWVRVFTK